MCPNALAASTKVLVDRWSRPHLAVCAMFGLVAWSAEVQIAGAVSPLAPACWLNVPDMSRSSASKAVQDVWEVYLETLRLVPLEVRDDLHKICHLEPKVDFSWRLGEGLRR